MKSVIVFLSLCIIIGLSAVYFNVGVESKRYITLDVSENFLNKVYNRKNELERFYTTGVVGIGNQRVLAIISSHGDSDILSKTRKSFRINFKSKLNLGLSKPMKKILLLGHGEDLHYTNIQLGMKIYKKLNLFCSEGKYFILHPKDKNKRLVSLVEDPVDCIRDFEKNKIVGIVRSEAENYMFHKYSVNNTEKQIVNKEIESLRFNLEKLKGVELVDYLRKKINLTQYLRWLVANRIMENCDFTDELFWVSKKTSKDSLYFSKFHGWDSESIFCRRSRLVSYKSKAHADSSILPLGYDIILKAIIENDILYSFYKRELVKTIEDLITPEFIEQSIGELRDELEVIKKNHSEIVFLDTTYKDIMANLDRSESRLKKNIKFLYDEAKK